MNYILAFLLLTSFSTIHFPKEGVKQIGKISLANRDEAISESTWIYINTALAEYKKQKPAAIILELNSPGGEVFAAERISDALKEMDTQYGIPIICYIDNWAISAGALIAYSSRYIVCSRDASMGAAEPIQVGAEGKPETASEKVNSALRADFANHAKFFGRNPYIAEAMVDKDIILVERDGKIIKVDEVKPSDIVISPKGKLLTLDAEQMIQYGVADMQINPERLPLLTLEEEESGIYPLSKSPLRQIPYFSEIEGIEIHEFQMNWQTKFLALLATPQVSSLLFMILLVSLYVEISSGGFGVAGAVALISLFLVLLSSFALEAITLFEPIVLVFGVILVALEIFFFPTLGILGVIGALFILMGLAGMLLPGLASVSYHEHSLNIAGEYVLSRLAWISAAFLVASVIILLLSKYMWPKFGLAKRLVLSDDMRSKELTSKEMNEPLLAVGELAVVTSALRPAGRVQAKEREFDAVSIGTFITEGTKVKVIRIEGAKVVVEEV